MKISFAIPFVAVIGACTPAQDATAVAVTQEAATILQSLNPVACGIVDVVDPSQAVAICEVITDASTVTTAFVPVVDTLATLNAVVAAKPADAATTAQIALDKSSLGTLTALRKLRAIKRP